MSNVQRRPKRQERENEPITEMRVYMKEPSKKHSATSSKNKTNIKQLPNKVTPTVYISRARWNEVMGSAGEDIQEPDILKQILPLPMPEPIFDGKQYVSTHLPLFVQKFGEPTQVKLFETYHCWKFSNGVYLTKDYFRFNCLLMFQAENNLLKEINIFLRILKLMYFPNAKFQLSQAEIAFDCLFPGKTNIEVEDIALELEKISTPVKHKAARTEIEGDSKKTGDGAINGRRTVYDNKNIRTDTGRKPSKAATRCEKMYQKSIDGVERVRFEETLKRSSLERYVGKEIPKSIFVNEGKKKVQITTFWDFYEFDYDAFRKAAYKIASKKSDKNIIKIIRVMMHLGGFEGATGRNFLIYKVANLLNSDYLKRRIGKGEFKHPIIVFKE